jgi:hypothetical protein
VVNRKLRFDEETRKQSHDMVEDLITKRAILMIQNVYLHKQFACRNIAGRLIGAKEEGRGRSDRLPPFQKRYQNHSRGSSGFLDVPAAVRKKKKNPFKIDETNRYGRYVL